MLVEAAGRACATVLEAARIIEARRRDRRPATSNGSATGARSCRYVVVPELFTRATGRRVVTLVADALAERDRNSPEAG